MTNQDMRGNRDIFSGKKVYTIERLSVDKNIGLVNKGQTTMLQRYIDFINRTSIWFSPGKLSTKKLIGCLNILGAHVTAINSTNYNVLFFFVSDLKIVCYNNNLSAITMSWTRK